MEILGVSTSRFRISGVPRLEIVDNVVFSGVPVGRGKKREEMVRGLDCDLSQVNTAVLNTMPVGSESSVDVVFLKCRTCGPGDVTNLTQDEAHLMLQANALTSDPFALVALNTLRPHLCETHRNFTHWRCGASFGFVCFYKEGSDRKVRISTTQTDGPDEGWEVPEWWIAGVR